MEVTAQNGVPIAQLHEAAATVHAEREGATWPAYRVWQRPHTQTRRLWSWRRGILVALALTVAGLIWQAAYRPTMVSIVQPTVMRITESLATTGRVSGTTEILVGAPAASIVDRLFVRTGEWVTAGERLAVLRHNIAAAQVAQAQAALHTTRAQAVQVARAPLRSDVEAATAHVRQARAHMDQQRAAVVQAEHAVAQARAQYNQFEAARDLAVRQYEHSTKLAVRGFIAQTAFDQAQANLRIAEAQLQAQYQALAVAQAAVTAAQAGVAAAQANVQAQEAHLRTVQTGARAEDIQVAQQRVEEAEQTLQVARQHAADAIVTAPRAGMVVALHAEVGQTVGPQGVLKLVSGAAEIRLEVDESHLADLSVGQAVTLSSSTFGDQPFQGTVSAIAAAVDAARGTVTVTIVPIAPPGWLRLGQTVNVNIITHLGAQRLLIPAAAIMQVGNSSGVLVVEQGRVRQKLVTTRPPTAQGVPVLTGLSVNDWVITNPQGLTVGEAVRIRQAVREGQ